MFENLKKLTIKGGCFDVETSLEIFKPNEPLNIVYGRNGSGKTTIARSIRQIAKTNVEEETPEYEVSLEEEIQEEIKSQVFVFDEDFLRDQVRVENDGLNEIVMLGEQVDLDNQINAKMSELETIITKWNVLKEKCDKYDNEKDTASPKFFFEKIREELREDGGWADIDRDIKGNQVKSRISPEVVTRLLQIDEPTAGADELKSQLTADMELYFQSDNAQPISWNLRFPEIPEGLYAAAGLLTQPLEKPELSEREKRLMAFLREHAQHYSQEATKTMLENKWEFCPLCLREAKENDIAFISETLTHILNEEANKFSNLLNEMLRMCRSVDEYMPEFPGDLNEKELKEAQLALGRLNRDLEEARRRLEQRKRNIYEPLGEGYSAEELKEYEAHYAQYRHTMQKLDECVMRFNKSVEERGQLKRKIHQENDLLARKQLTALLHGYNLAMKTRDSNALEFQRMTEVKEAKENEIRALKAQKNRTDIALDYINMELQYVFYSDKKVKLMPGDGCYKLVVNGKAVKPKKISVGERNVLGLCYFFAMLFSGKRNEDKYASESLIVIDDPVSSFDYGNRLGVMSLLRYQFHSIIKGNSKSRILVMSHDLPSVFDLVKIRSELRGGQSSERKFMELENRALKEQKVQNEYRKLLLHVYEYANNRRQDDLDEMSEMSIGNIMRRLMEAFASFCYNTSFEMMMCKDGVLDAINLTKRPYYENFMCRLTLNGESHEEEHVYSLNTMTRYFTKDEKVQTAKSLLLFLMYVNEEHLKAYCDFEKNPVMFNTIKSWQSEEAGWLPAIE